MKKMLFTKMHGAGNDFIMVVDTAGRDRTFWTKTRVRALCDRRTGIGGDGLIVLSSLRGKGHYNFSIYNADGSAAETCVNGLRCATLLLGTPGKKLLFKTRAGLVETSILKKKNNAASVQVVLGSPLYAAEPLPPLGKGKNRLPLVAINVGNPHVVARVADFNFDWSQTAMMAQQRSPFSRGTNVEFMRIVSRRKIELRIYERGVGPTLSSGSGATAAVLAGMREDLLDNAVDVVMPGGRVKIKYDPRLDRLLMIGPAVTIYSGEIRLS